MAVLSNKLEKEKMKIEQIRLIHSAFKHRKANESSTNHVATFVPMSSNVDEAMQELFSKTQNVDESWVKLANGQFTLRPVTNTRSTSVGDIMTVCYQNPKGNGFKEVWYKVDDWGFSKWFDK